MKINIVHVLATGDLPTDHVLSLELVFLSFVSFTKIPINRKQLWIAMHIETEISVFALYATNFYLELNIAYLPLQSINRMMACLFDSVSQS